MIVSALRILPAALLLAACGATPANTAAAVTKRDVMATKDAAAPTATPGSNDTGSPASRNDKLAGEHATIVAELRRLLVGTDATLDGAAITDVAQIDACRTRFVTDKGATNIEWAKGGNITPRDEAGRELNDLPASDGAHILSVKTGEEADGVSGAVGLLVGECGGGE